MKRYDAIIVLGGGRDDQGNLTPLSIQRLDKGVDLYQQGEAEKVFALDGHRSVCRPDVPYFAQTGAQKRKMYLVERVIPSKDTVVVEDEQGDTISEAFASRRKCKELGLRRIILVTSDKHMKRALWIFRRIFERRILRSKGDAFRVVIYSMKTKKRSA